MGKFFSKFQDTASYNAAKSSLDLPHVSLIEGDGIAFDPKPNVPESFVDLGLPSGLFWAEYNIGVNLKQLTSASDWYGKYVMWGELEEKAGWNDQGTKVPYDWANYKYANGSKDTLTKYCNMSTLGNEGFTDELTQLVPTDDVATVTNSAWRMPTKEDFDELRTLSSQWVTDYNDVSGLNGRVFTGTNGNTLFIPAAGCRDGSNTGGQGSNCMLWSSSLFKNYPSYAYLLAFSSNYISTTDYNDRYYGFRVRAVC